MVDSFTLQNVSATTGPSSVAKQGTKQIIFFDLFCTLFATEEGLSYAQEPSNT